MRFANWLNALRAAHRDGSSDPHRDRCRTLAGSVGSGEPSGPPSIVAPSPLEVDTNSVSSGEVVESSHLCHVQNGLDSAHRWVPRPGSNHRLLVVGLVVLLAGIAGTQFAKGCASLARREAQGTIHPLQIVPGDDQFGDLWENVEVERTVRFVNRGLDPLTIAGFQRSCSCTDITPSRSVIRPGEQKAFTVRIRVTTNARAKAPRDDQFSVTVAPVFVSAEGTTRPVRFQLYGHVRGLYRLEPGSVDFGRISELAEPIAPRSYRLTCLGPVRAVEANAPGWVVSVLRKNEAGRQYDLVIGPVGVLPKKRINDPLRLTFTLEDGTSVPVTVQVRGAVVSDIEPSVPAVSFGARVIGESCQDEILLRSMTNTPFSMRVKEVTGPGLSVSCEPTGSRGSWRVIVASRVVAAGPQTGNVRLQITYPGRATGEAELSLPVQGFGCPASDVRAAAKE